MSEMGSMRGAEIEWTGCVHCGQTLPHAGTGWRESSRCRLFQRIAERAWDEGYGDDFTCNEPRTNPYRPAPPAPTNSTHPSDTDEETR